MTLHTLFGRLWPVAVAAGLALQAAPALGQAPATQRADAKGKRHEAKPAARELAKDAGKGQAQPAAAATTEILVLYASNSGKGIDKRIGEMSELEQPPFSAYDSYELLQKQRFALDKGQSKKLTLPNKRVLETKLLEVLPKDFVRLSASINQPGGKDFLPLLEVKAKRGQQFIVAGQRYKSGILVLVIRVR